MEGLNEENSHVRSCDLLSKMGYYIEDGSLFPCCGVSLTRKPKRSLGMFTKEPTMITHEDEH